MAKNIVTGRCGAKTRAGHPCQRKPVQGKRRCRNHGGLSTGPKTPEGKARALAALDAVNAAAEMLNVSERSLKNARVVIERGGNPSI